MPYKAERTMLDIHNIQEGVLVTLQKHIDGILVVFICGFVKCIRDSIRKKFREVV